MKIMSLILVLLFTLSPLSAMGAPWSLKDIMSGGPPRDGIPALFSPKYVKAADAGFMRNEEGVLGVYRNGIARAYPTRILSHHELVNDNFGEDPILVSW